MVVALALGEPMDIADLVGQRHYSVSISIQRLVDRGVIALPPMVECPTPSGQLAKVYVFKGDQGKRDSITAPPPNEQPGDCRAYRQASCRCHA